MQIIIVGCGSVGRVLIEQLSREEHNITVIDQAALVRELNARRLYAGLDVYETEPVPQDDPLWNCPNLLMTPHIAGDVTLPYTLDRIVDLFLEDFGSYCAGRPLKRQVALQRGY